MTIRFALIGCGHIAKRHAQCIAAHPDAELVSAYDIKPEKTYALATEFDIDAAETLEDLISRDDVDVVSICTPNGLHFEHTVAALKAGKDVLVEKPMALKREDCEEMVNLSMKNNKRLFVVKQNRYNPPVKALKKLIEEKALGTVYYLVINCFWNRGAEYYRSSDWKGRKDLDGGTLFTQFSHFIDALYYVFGDIQNIHGVVKNVSHRGLIEFEDTGSFTFTLKNGEPGSFNYTTSAFAENMEGSMTIFSEKATIKIGGKYLDELTYYRGDGIDLSTLPVTSSPNEYGSYTGSSSNHEAVISNVIQTIRGHEQMSVSGLEGMKVVEMIENIYKGVTWL